MVLFVAIILPPNFAASCIHASHTSKHTSCTKPWQRFIAIKTFLINTYFCLLEPPKVLFVCVCVLATRLYMYRLLTLLNPEGAITAHQQVSRPSQAGKWHCSPIHTKFFLCEYRDDLVGNYTPSKKIEPTCAYPRWALMHLSVCLSVWM